MPQAILRVLVDKICAEHRCGNSNGIFVILFFLHECRFFPLYTGLTFLDVEHIQEFTFDYNGTTFFDLQTESTWLITGQATDGPLKGKTLTPLPHGDFFAFAYLVFKPNTKIYE